MIHELKVKPKQWPYYKNGDKPFSVRKNDRNYAVGDICIFKLWEDDRFILNEVVVKKISYVLSDYDTTMIKNGNCVLGLKDV